MPVATSSGTWLVSRGRRSACAKTCTGVKAVRHTAALSASSALAVDFELIRPPPEGRNNLYQDEILHNPTFGHGRLTPLYERHCRLNDRERLNHRGGSP